MEREKNGHLTGDDRLEELVHLNRQPPLVAARLVDERIRKVVTNELHLLWIEIQVRIQAMGDLTKIDQGAGVESILLIECKLLLLANGLIEVSSCSWKSRSH